MTKKTQKWAVENVSLIDSTVRVRVMETPQEWTAELISGSANECFERTRRPYRSEYFEI